MKNRWTLLPWAAMDKVVSVLTSGAEKHGEDGYKSRAAQSYIDAALRHIAEHQKGVTADHETGQPPLAHAVADLLFAMELGRETMTLPSGLFDTIPEVNDFRGLFSTPDHSFSATDRHCPLEDEYMGYDLSALDLPEWATWIATESAGALWAYQYEPIAGAWGWTTERGKYMCLDRLNPPNNWRSTKRKVDKPATAADILPHDIYGPITDLPDWANWVATDSDGDVYVYEEEPILQDDIFDVPWQTGTEFKRINTVKPPKDWRSTKRKIKR